jgi:hypothetical protein
VKADGMGFRVNRSSTYSGHYDTCLGPQIEIDG